MRTATFVESRVSADIRFECLGIWTSSTCTAKDKDDEFRFAINLLGVAGRSGTSVGLGTLDRDRLR